MKLRDYQTEAVEQAAEIVRKGGHPLIQLWTGAGKTTVGGAIFNGVRKKGNRALWIAHRQELTDQAAERLELMTGIRKMSRIEAGHDFDPSADIQVASIQTLVSRQQNEAVLEWLAGCDVVLTDECHKGEARSYEILRELTPNATRIGLTATPVRLDGRGLGDTYTDIVSTVSCTDLVELGFLIEPTYFTTDTVPSFDGVRKIGGDYSKKATSKMMGSSKVVGSIIGTWFEKARGRSTIVFAASVLNSRQLCRKFMERGIPAEHIDGTTKKDVRREIMERFKSGKTMVLCNYGIATEGVDVPRAEVACIARPTMSWSLHHQMIGRIMRTFEGKTGALVLDHAGNLVRHGFPTDHFEFDLERGSFIDKAPKAKICKNCLAVNPVTARVCVCCGQPFPTRVTSGPQFIDGELQSAKAEKPTASDKAAYAARLLATAAREGHRISWVVEEFRKKFGARPRTQKGFDYKGLKQKAFKQCKHVKRAHGACVFCGDVDLSVMSDDKRKDIKRRVLRNRSRENVYRVAREHGIDIGTAYRIASA